MHRFSENTYENIKEFIRNIKNKLYKINDMESQKIITQLEVHINNQNVASIIYKQFIGF